MAFWGLAEARGADVVHDSMQGIAGSLFRNGLSLRRELTKGAVAELVELTEIADLPARIQSAA